MHYFTFLYIEGHPPPLCPAGQLIQGPLQGTGIPVLLILDNPGHLSIIRKIVDEVSHNSIFTCHKLAVGSGPSFILSKNSAIPQRAS